MIIEPYESERYLIDNHIKILYIYIYIYILISFKFNYIPYKIDCLDLFTINDCIYINMVILICVLPLLNYIHNSFRLLIIFRYIYYLIIS